MECWEQFLISQEKELGKESVNRWLRTLKIVRFDACNLYLAASDSFQIAWFEEHIRQKTERLVNNNHRPIKVHLSLLQESGSIPLASKRNTKPLYPPIHFKADLIDPLATFEHFIAGTSNQILLTFLSHLNEVQYNPVFLYGPQASGKTHLLMAAAHHLRSQGKSVFYVHAETFTEHVVQAIRGSQMQEFRNIYRHHDVLLIDDIHLLAKRSATQEELFHTFNTLHVAGKQIIFTSLYSPHHLIDIEPRLVSRFEWGIAFSIEKLTQDEMKQLLKKRCELMQVSFKDEVIDFLVSQFSSHLKNLMKALQALILRVPSFKSHVHVAAVKDILQDLITFEKEHLLSPEKIVFAVAKQLQISVNDLMGKSQKQECSFARQLSMFLLRKKLNMPFLKIGKFFDRDHSTVISSINLIEKKLIEKPEILSAIDLIETSLKENE